MRYSKFFGKTIKDVSKNVQIDSHKLLLKGGFIRESVAGRYFFLPLGTRVNNKIIDIIRKEMNKSGALEMSAPILHPLELWQETNRDNAANFGLMRVKDRRGAEFALGGTAEEMFVDVVRKFQISYKDLPFNIYQFSQKFRDELRARGGLFRVREFMMKDAYSFDRNAEEFLTTYKSMEKAYLNIFNAFGLKANVVLADNGFIGGEYCHELIVDCEAGESRYLTIENGGDCVHEDVAKISLPIMNADEEVKALETIEQPAWVKTMDDNIKHYKQPAWRFLKNVVYKNIVTLDIVIVTIRGDLQVNKTKLEHVLGAIEQLDDATEADLQALGTKSGSVHSWGETVKNPSHLVSGKVIYVADESLKSVRNFIGGQKMETTDTINVNYGRDFKHEVEADVVLAQSGQLSADGKNVWVEKKGMEVGNIFQLGTHYSSKMNNAVFMDKDGESKPYYMGCYGIGVGRTLQTIVELSHDDRGIIWPKNIAPFTVHLIGITGKDETTLQVTQDFYKKLQDLNIEVLWDDRDDVSVGSKFADADLIGCPVRLVISAKNQGKIEWKLRTQKEVELLDEQEVIAKITNL